MDAAQRAAAKARWAAEADTLHGLRAAERDRAAAAETSALAAVDAALAEAVGIGNAHRSRAAAHADKALRKRPPLPGAAGKLLASGDWRLGAPAARVSARRAVASERLGRLVAAGAAAVRDAAGARAVATALECATCDAASHAAFSAARARAEAADADRERTAVETVDGAVGAIVETAVAEAVAAVAAPKAVAAVKRALDAVHTDIARDFVLLRSALADREAEVADLEATLKVRKRTVFGALSGLASKAGGALASVSLFESPEKKAAKKMLAKLRAKRDGGAGAGGGGGMAGLVPRKFGKPGAGGGGGMAGLVGKKPAGGMAALVGKAPPGKAAAAVAAAAKYAQPDSRAQEELGREESKGGGGGG